MTYLQCPLLFEETLPDERGKFEVPLLLLEQPGERVCIIVRPGHLRQPVGT